MASASNPHSRKHLFRATPLPVTPPPVKPRAVALPPADIPSPDKTIAAQLKINALQKKTTIALVNFFTTVAGIVLIIYLCSNPERSQVWFIKVSDGDIYKSIPNPITRSLFSSATGPLELSHWKFSLQKFFCSGAGWLVIGACICAVREAMIYVKYANALKAASNQNQGTGC